MRPGVPDPAEGVPAAQQLCAAIVPISMEGAAKDAARDALLMLSMLVRHDSSQGAAFQMQHAEWYGLMST